MIQKNGHQEMRCVLQARVKAAVLYRIKNLRIEEREVPGGFQKESSRLGERTSETLSLFRNGIH